MKKCTGLAALSAAAVLALGAGSVCAQRSVGVSGANKAGSAGATKTKAQIKVVGDGVDGDGGGSVVESALWYNGADDRQVGYLSTVNAHVQSEVADDCWLKEGMWYDCFTAKVRMAVTDGFLPNTQLYIYADCDGKPDSGLAPMVIPQGIEANAPVLIDANPGGDLDGTDIWEITYVLNQFKPGEDLRWFSPVHTGSGFAYWLSAGNGTVQGKQAQVRAPAFGLPEWSDADNEICCGYCTDMYLIIDGKCCWRVLAQSNFDLDGLTSPVLAQNAPWVRSFDDFQLADPCKEVDAYGICRIEAFFATNCDLDTIYGEIFNNLCDMPVDPDNAPYRLTPTNIVPLGMTVLSGTTPLPVYRVEFICPPDVLPNAQNYWFSIFSEQGFVAGKRSVWLYQQRELCNIRLNEAKYRNTVIGFDMPTPVSDPDLEGAPRGFAFSVWVCKPEASEG